MARLTKEEWIEFVFPIFNALGDAFNDGEGMALTDEDVEYLCKHFADQADETERLESAITALCGFLRAAGVDARYENGRVTVITRAAASPVGGGEEEKGTRDEENSNGDSRDTPIIPRVPPPLPAEAYVPGVNSKGSKGN